MSDEIQIADIETLDNFDRAFSTERGCCVTCNCGKVYWDCANSGNDWAEGEIERLEADPNATAVEYAIDVIYFEGKSYANACTCWHPRASRIIGWLEDNRDAICLFYKLEKERKVAAANRLAVTE